MAETQIASELDKIMQRHIDSGLYSESELAEMRKREANKLKNTRETSWWRGEEGLIPDELQPGVSRPRVSKTEEPKTEVQKVSEQLGIQHLGLLEKLSKAVKSSAKLKKEAVIKKELLKKFKVADIKLLIKHCQNNSGKNVKDDDTYDKHEIVDLGKELKFFEKINLKEFKE